MKTLQPYTSLQAITFRQYFGKDLKEYWDFTGFDVIKFDEEVIKPADGVSTRQAILSNYGTDACTFIQKLINY